MDGSAASLIAIPIVVTLGLLTWLSLIAYAVRHPLWAHRTSAAARGNRVPGDHVVIELGAGASAEKPARLAA